MKLLPLAVALLCVATWSACTDHPKMNSPAASMPQVPEGAETATLAAGCFWCIEAVFQQLDGVLSVTSGYTGGSVDIPSYEAICRGETGHAEALLVVFDPKRISYGQLLETFWKMHDPTQLNRQGNDVGTQYRSAIFYHNDEQRRLAEESKADAQKHQSGRIVTEITEAPRFYPAEAYHQDYYRQNKNRNPYCRLIIQPKLGKLGLEE